MTPMNNDKRERWEEVRDIIAAMDCAIHNAIKKVLDDEGGYEQLAARLKKDGIVDNIIGTAIACYVLKIDGKSGANGEFCVGVAEKICNGVNVGYFGVGR